MRPSALCCPGPAAIVLWLAGALAAQATEGPAQPAPRLQPTALDLGVLAVGATIETSFGVFWTEAALATAKATVEAPADVTVVGVTTGPYGDNALTQVELVLATDRASTVDTVVTVRCGTEVARLPLRAQLVAMPPGGSRVLVASPPFETFSTSDPATLDAWRQVVASARLEVDYRIERDGRATFDVDALRRVDVVLVGESALCSLDDAQLALLQGFACGGGRLLVFANAFYGNTTQQASRLCEPFGLRILDAELQGGGGFTAEAEDVRRHPLTVGVENLSVQRPSPVELLDAKAGVELIRFAAPVAQTFVAMASTQGGGEVIAVGDSLWWNSANQSPGYARLLRNLLVRPPRVR